MPRTPRRIVGLIAFVISSLLCPSFLCAIASASELPKPITDELQTSCHALTWDVPLTSVLGGGPSGDYDSLFTLYESLFFGNRSTTEGFYSVLENAPDVPAPDSLFFEQPAALIAVNPWYWTKIPHRNTRRPGLFLTFREWFSGFAPYFDLGRLRAFAASVGRPGLGAFANAVSDPRRLTQGLLDDGLAAFFADSRTHDRLDAELAALRVDGWKSFTPKRLAETLRGAYSDPQGANQIDVSPTSVPELAAACALIRGSPVGNLACGTSASNQAKHLLTGSARSLAGELLIPILTSEDPRVARASFALARRVYARFVKRDASGSLFADAESAFLNQGFTVADSEEWAWQTMLLAFVHGQNTGLELRTRGYVQPYNFWSIFSADFISAAAVYLDSIRQKGSRHALYSIPAEVVSTSCDNGKPYHFWVAAYSARRARQAGFGEWAARWGAYVLDVGYEMTSYTFGRNPDRDLSDGKFSVWNARNRLDLANAAAGAAYGARTAFGARLDRPYLIDAAYRSLHDARERPALDVRGHFPDMSGTKIEKGLFAVDWVRMMSPAEGLRAIERREAKR